MNNPIWCFGKSNSILEYESFRMGNPIILEAIIANINLLIYSNKFINGTQAK